MQIEDCFLVGTVFKLHGYKGDVNIYNDNDILFNFNTIQFFLVEQNKSLVPFFIEKARHTKKNIILVKFDQINSEEEAKSILRNKIFLPNTFLPEMDKNEINKKELIGFQVIDSQLGELGKIEYINSETAQTLIYVGSNENEFCFPMHEQFILEIDEKSKIMQVEIPEELLKLN
ncbi:MAG: 16S rRNA processing protein RimM [Flavobacteriales bacterium]|nr:16S rRNA processing protein RimM [Flavobacteriales bacterium]|tara:strand:- start:32050 stop:32571 length:522 start_codon:yes stop_codon:yes gene_type:complete